MADVTDIMIMLEHFHTPLEHQNFFSTFKTSKTIQYLGNLYMINGSSATLETKCDTSIEENGGSARILFICEYNLTQKKVKIGHAFTVPEHSFQLFIPMFSR